MFVPKLSTIFVAMYKVMCVNQGRINATRGLRHIFSAGPLHSPSAEIKSLSDAMKNRIVFQNYVRRTIWV